MPLVTKASRPSVLGALVVARVPAVIETHRSRVLLPSGDPVRSLRIFSVSSWIVWVSADARLGGFLREAERRLGSLLDTVAQPGYL